MYIKFESIILSRRAEKPYKILLCSKKKKKFYLGHGPDGYIFFYIRSIYPRIGLF